MPDPVELSSKEREMLDRILRHPLAELRLAVYVSMGFAYVALICHIVEWLVPTEFLDSDETSIALMLCGSLCVLLASFYSSSRKLHYQANIIRDLEDRLGGDEGPVPAGS